MSAARVETAYINGTGASAASSTVARSEAFYEKLLQLHKDVVAGKHPRLSFNATSQNRNALSTAVTPTAHLLPSHLPSAINNNAVSKPTASATSTPAKIAGSSSRHEPTDDPVKLKRIREQRQQLERSIAEYAKADEPILKNAREIPLNLLALAHAQVPPISGLKADSSDESSNDDSYYSSKANSWSTEHTEPRAQTDNAIVISDEDNEELYEPPSQVHGQMAYTGQSKGHRHDTVNSNGEWEPDWDEDDDYEPPAPAAFGGRPVPQTSSASHRQVYGQMQASEYVDRLHGAAPSSRGAQMPTIALNHIPTPAAPQPSRISPLTTGHITHTMQSQISSLDQVQNAQGDTQGNTQALSAKELKRQRRMAKKEAKAAATGESSKKRKRGATPPGQQDSKGKRRAVDNSPESYIKPEPTSPPPGVGSIPSRRNSVVNRMQAEPAVQSSPYRPRSAYVSDQENSPRQYRYVENVSTDRMAMPPPKVRRTDRDDQDLRRVASLQYARRPLSPAQDPAYASPRGAASRYDYDEPSTASRGSGYREPSVRPSTARPARTPSPRGGEPYASRYAPLAAPRPGQIVTDAYGNRYIAELVPEYPPASRRPHPDDYYGQQPSRREVYADDPYRAPQPSRAYSRMPEADLDRRPRAYSTAPEPIPDPRASRAYSVHPGAAVPQRREVDDYDRRRAPSRYQEQTSPRVASTYSSDYPPVPRAFSVRPEAARPERPVEYASMRAGSMAPSGGYARREMAPPALPVMRSRAAAEAEDYRYAQSNDGRDQYDERRAVSYRY